MNQDKHEDTDERKLAERVRNACIEASREGFRDALLSGLCTEGAMEAAISAMQALNMDDIIKRQQQE
jgi:hypothetical protein